MTCSSTLREQALISVSETKPPDCGLKMNFVIPDFYPAAAELFVVAMSFVILLAGPSQGTAFVVLRPS
jgi:hypothetical protein